MKTAGGQIQASFFKSGWLYVVLAFLLYANTLGHRYVLDDEGLAVKNSMTEAGPAAFFKIFSSGYRSTLSWSDHQFYRPIPKLMHAICWWIAPANPTFAHFLNVLVFASICMLVFLLVNQLTQNRIISSATALIFCCHPIHTEVVANIKGLDELLAMLFLLLAIRTSITSAHGWKMSPATFLYFLLALGCKESAIALVIILPLIHYFFLNESKSDGFKRAAILALPAGLFFIVRWLILGEQDIRIDPTVNALVGIPDVLDQRVNAIFLFGVYLLKLVWPYPLLCDASMAHFTVVGLTDWQFLLSALALLILLLLLKGTFQKKWYSFCVLFFLFSFGPLSNVFFLIGTNYAERFLFLPSFSFCLAGGFLFAHLNLTGKGWKMAGAVVLLAFCVQTIARNGDWESNRTLFRKEVETSPNTARLQCYYASSITNPLFLNKQPDEQKRAYLRKGIEAYEKAIQIYPAFHEAYNSIGDCYVQLSQFNKAEIAFKNAIEFRPSSANYHNNLAGLYFRWARYDLADASVRKAVTLDSNYAAAWSNFGNIYGVKAQQAGNRNEPVLAELLLDSSILAFEHAIRIDPLLPAPHQYLAQIYTYRKMPDKAGQHQLLFSQLNKKANRWNLQKAFD